jgi:NitT/TauT family transport system substrate-binding protein
MKRRAALTLLAAPALMALIKPGSMSAKEHFTYGYLLDPAFDAALWALANGKVSSDMIAIETRPLSIPQLIQAAAAKQYDALNVAVISIPAAESRGLRMTVLSTALQQSASGEGSGIWVRKDSPLKSPNELKGKTLGSYGLRSTGHTQIRLALQHKYRLNAALEGGDVEQVEIQAPNLPAALATSKVDAAALIHSQAYRAGQSGDYRVIAETGRDNIEMFKVRFISAVNGGYPEKIAQRPDAYREFNRMFRESVTYARTNRAEVFGAVGRQSNLDRGFFDWWFDKAFEVPGFFDENHAQSIMKLYELSRGIGMIQSYPDIRSLVWEHAPRS